MTAQAATFPPFLQQAMEAGVISPQQAWQVEWELIARSTLPWDPMVFALNQRAKLWMWPVEEARPQ